MREKGAKLMLLLGVAVLTAVVVAGCGGGSSTTDGGSSTTGSSTQESNGSAETAGSPKDIVKIGTLYLNSGGILYPQTMETMEAYADRLNAEGGINGHGVEVIGCDGNLEDPTALPNCEQKLVNQEKVIAFAGSIFDEGLGKLIDSAGVANLVSDVNSPGNRETANSFPITCDTQCETVAFIQMAKLDGLKKVAYLYVSQPGVSGKPVEELEEKLAAVGVEMTAIAAPVTTTNYGALAAKAKESGAEAAFLALANQGQIGFLKSSKALGYEPTVYGFLAVCDTELSETIPWTTFICASAVQPFDEPAWDQWHETMEQYGNDPHPVSAFSGQAALGFEAVEAVLKGIPAGKSVTRSSFLEATKKLKFTPKIGVPGNEVNFTKEDFPCPIYPRWSGKYMLAVEMNDGESKLHIKEPLEVCE